MLLDLRELPDTSDFDADVCIVGAGPAGIALAGELLGAGLKIVVLESGGLQIDAATQSLNQGEVAGLPHVGLLEGRGRAFGGSAKLWAGQCLRLDPLDFERRDWVPDSGWPFGASHLDPFYRRAEAFFKVDGQPYDDSVYRSFGLVPPAWAADALRTHFTVYTPEVDTGRFHLQQLSQSRDIRIVTQASVVRIDTNTAMSRVETVHARSMTGRCCAVRARAVVLCGGGLENARLLLNADHRRSVGLGNGRGLVGRFFQDHPNGLVATLAGGDPRDLQDRFRLLYRKKHRFFPKFALSAERQRATRVLNANAHLVFEYDEQPALGVMRELLESARRGRLPENPWRQAVRLAGDAGSIGNVLWRRYVHGRSPTGVPTAVRLQCYLEQAPNTDSRVSLSEHLDPFGLPLLRLDWRLTDIEHRTLRTLVDAVRDEFLRLRLGQIRADAWVADRSDAWQTKLVDCYHHAGTTRMATHPSQGVVDEDCQVFGVDGLFVCGGSVFPTSGYANPTLTIVALALRLADHLRAQLAERATSRADETLSPV